MRVIEVIENKKAEVREDGEYDWNKRMEEKMNEETRSK
jgi:hypothetical protein